MHARQIHDKHGQILLERGKGVRKNQQDQGKQYAFGLEAAHQRLFVFRKGDLVRRKKKREEILILRHSLLKGKKIHKPVTISQQNRTWTRGAVDSAYHRAAKTDESDYTTDNA